MKLYKKLFNLVREKSLNGVKNLKINWFLKHTITVFSCVLIIVLGIAAITYADSVTTTIGENISTNSLTATGLTVNGNATTTGTLNVAGDTTLATTTLSGDLAVDTDTFYVDTENNRVGIGTTNPEYKLTIENNLLNVANGHPEKSSLFINHTLSRTLNGTTYCYANRIFANHDIAENIVDSGHTYAIHVNNVRNLPTDAGEIQGVSGIGIYYGHKTGVNNSAVTTSGQGLRIMPRLDAGHIGTMIDLLISTPTTGGTFGSHWAIYQESSETPNYFGGSVGISDDSQDALLEVSASAGALDLFMLSSNDNTDGDRFIVKNNGDVGIGTTAPGAKLDVAQTGGTSGTNNAILLRAGNSGTYFGNNQILFSYGGGEGYRHAIKTRHDAVSGNENAIDFYLWDYGVDTSGSVGTQHVMTLNNGNVGIGTTSPAVKLEVDGIIKTTPAASRTCDADSKGGIYYDSDVDHFYGCNGSSWVQLDN